MSCLDEGVRLLTCFFFLHKILEGYRSSSFSPVPPPPPRFLVGSGGSERAWMTALRNAAGGVDRLFICMTVSDVLLSSWTSADAPFLVEPVGSDLQCCLLPLLLTTAPAACGSVAEEDSGNGGEEENVDAVAGAVVDPPVLCDLTWWLFSRGVRLSETGPPTTTFF